MPAVLWELAKHVQVTGAAMVFARLGQGRLGRGGVGELPVGVVVVDQQRGSICSPRTTAPSV